MDLKCWFPTWKSLAATLKGNQPRRRKTPRPAARRHPQLLAEYLEVRVLPSSATVAVTGVPDPAPLGQSVTFSATVTPAVGPGTGFAVPTANSQPYYVTTGSDGNLWFTEQAANKIGRITPSGTFTEFAIPTAGSSP